MINIENSYSLASASRENILFSFLSSSIAPIDAYADIAFRFGGDSDQTFCSFMSSEWRIISTYFIKTEKICVNITLFPKQMFSKFPRDMIFFSPKTKCCKPVLSHDNRRLCLRPVKKKETKTNLLSDSSCYLLPSYCYQVDVPIFLRKFTENFYKFQEIKLKSHTCAVRASRKVVHNHHRNRHPRNKSGASNSKILFAMP